MFKSDMTTVMKAEIGQDIAQNSMLPSGQLVRSARTSFHDWK